jgi:hypothetical protein
MDPFEIHLALDNFVQAKSVAFDAYSKGERCADNTLALQSKLDRIIDKQHKRQLQRRARVQVPVVIREDGLGAVLGLELSEGGPPPPGLPSAFAQAIQHAVGVVWRWLLPRDPIAGAQDSGFPPPVLEASVDAPADLLDGLEGASVGLPAALEAFRCLTGARAPASPLIATGALTDDRKLKSVDTGPKRDAAIREHWGTVGAMFLSPDVADGESEGLVVRRVTTLEEAVVLVFGEAAAREAAIASTFFDGHERCEVVQRWIASREYERAMAAAAADWSMFKEPTPTLARWLGARAALHLGVGGARRRYREVSHAVLHAWRSGLLDDEKYARFLAEEFVSRLDEFEVDDVIEELTSAVDNLEATGQRLHAMLHLRGTLALAHAMAGHHEQAVHYRKLNAEIHEDFEGFAETAPRTFCNLAWELGRAGDLEAAWAALAKSEKAATHLKAESGQEYFNLHARMRLHMLASSPGGCVRAFEEATAGDPLRARRFADLEASGFYLPQLMRVTLGAAFRALGRHEEAIAAIQNARRPLSSGGDHRGIVPWLVYLGLGYEISSLVAAGTNQDARELSHRAVSWMGLTGDTAVFPAASRYYSEVRNCPLPLSEDAEETAKALRAWHAMSWY